MHTSVGKALLPLIFIVDSRTLFSPIPSAVFCPSLLHPSISAIKTCWSPSILASAVGGG